VVALEAEGAAHGFSGVKGSGVVRTNRGSGNFTSQRKWCFLEEKGNGLPQNGRVVFE
jgi:hypothetical protein